MFSRTRSMVSTSVVLIVIRSPAIAALASTSESSSEVKMVLMNARVRLLVLDGFRSPAVRSAGGDSLPGRIGPAYRRLPRLDPGYPPTAPQENSYTGGAVESGHSPQRGPPMAASKSENLAPTSVAEAKRVPERDDRGGRRIFKQKQNNTNK